MTTPSSASLASLGRPNGGIYCATVGCSTKHGRTKGHTECSDKLCKTCCAKASRKALADGIDRPSCHVRSHRLSGVVGSATHTRGLRSQSQTSHTISSSFSNDPLPIDTDSTAVQSTATSMAVSKLVPNPPTQHAGSTTTTYALPIANQWQTPTRGWLRNHQEAANAVDEEAERKRRIVEANMRNQHTVQARIWCMVCCMPFRNNVDLTSSIGGRRAHKHIIPCPFLSASANQQHTGTCRSSWMGSFQISIPGGAL